MDYYDGIWFIKHAKSPYSLIKAGFEQDKELFYTENWLIADKMYSLGTELAKQEIMKLKNAAIKSSRQSSSDINIPVPKGLRYLDYQKAGIEFASSKKYTLISDQPGCGKTIQVIGLANLKQLRSILIICPASLKENWRREFNKWKTYNITIDVCDGKSFPDSDVAIINYEQVKKFRDKIHAREWDLLCCDESHYLKSNTAQRTNEIIGGGKHRIKPIPHKAAVFLTGTPLLNRPEEIWTTVKFMKLFNSSDWEKFHTRYCNAKRTKFGWDTSGASNLGELNDLLRSTIMIRRLKEDVLKELPKKSRRVVAIDLEAGELEKAVSQKADKMGFDLAGLSDSQLEIIFESVAKERVILGNSKIQPAFKYLIELLNGGVEAIVVFAEHKAVLDGLQEKFSESGISCARIDGDVKSSLRVAEVDKFQSGEAKIFLGTIKAAGVGITLTKSSYVVFVEPSWTPSDIVQAEDRCHRIGAINAVQVDYIVAKDTIDEVIMQKVIKKAEIISSALDNDGDVVEELKPSKSINHKSKKATELHKSQWENFLKGKRVKAIIETATGTHELIKSYGKWYIDGAEVPYLPDIQKIWHQGCCSACGRKLTDPESIERGLGPVCSGIKL